MEILGVGPSEFIFIVILALIVLGPKDMQKAGKTIGKWLRNIVTSDGWKMFQQTSRELRTLPNRLMRDAGNEINQIGTEINNTSKLSGSIPYHTITPPRPNQPTPIIRTPADKPNPSAPTDIKANESNPKQDA